MGLYQSYRPRPTPSCGWIANAGAALMWAAVAAAAAPQHPAAPHRHPEAQTLTNPVAPSEAVLAQGAALYAQRCAACHGANGLGNGRLAAGMAAYGRRPSDLTDAVWQHGSSDGEIFSVIRDGLGEDSQMPSYGKLLSDADIWAIVHHLRSLTP